jgi:phosphoglycerate dehydrogenase-like enzyme
MRIVFLDFLEGLEWKPEHIEQLQSYGEVTVHKDNPENEEEAIARLEGADIAVITGVYPLTRKVIEASSSLKYIVVAAIGFNSTDVAAAREKNISVSNCPGHNAQAVAEYTTMLMIGAARNVKKTLLDIDDGIFNMDIYRGFQLSDKKVAILGYGNIAKRLEKILTRGFGCEVKYINSQSSEDDFYHILAWGDFVVSTLPLNEQTKEIIGVAEFATMKDEAIFVNIGRGGTVDEQALIEALENKTIAGAALDVLQQEPTPADNPLLKMENALVTPHTAWNTEEGAVNLSRSVLDNITAFVNGEPVNVVN